MRAYMAIASALCLIVSVVFLVYGLRTKSGLLVTHYGPTEWCDREREPFKYWLAIGEWAFLALVGMVLLLGALFLPG
jgi:hypothetical protein